MVYRPKGDGSFSENGTESEKKKSTKEMVDVVYRPNGDGSFSKNETEIEKKKSTKEMVETAVTVAGAVVAVAGIEKKKSTKEMVESGPSGIQAGLLKDKTLKTKGKRPANTSPANTNQATKKPKGKQTLAQINEPKIILRPQKPEKQTRGRLWKPSNHRPISQNQLEILHKAFSQTNNPELIRMIEKEFSRIHKQSIQQPIQEIPSRWPIARIRYGFEIDEEIIDKENPLNFNYFKTKIFPSFFQQEERAGKIQEAICSYRSSVFDEQRSKAFQKSCFSKLAFDNQLHEKMNLQISYFSWGFKVFTKIDPKLFTEIFELGFINEIDLNSSTLAMINQACIPAAIKKFVCYIHDNHDGHSIKVATANPIFQYSHWNNLEEAGKDLPCKYYPIWVVMEHFDPDISPYKVQPRYYQPIPIEETNDLAVNRRAAGLNKIQVLLNSPDHFIWSDNEGIQCLALSELKRTVMWDYFGEEGFLTQQQRKKIVGSNNPYEENMDSKEPATETVTATATETGDYYHRERNNNKSEECPVEGNV